MMISSVFTVLTEIHTVKVRQLLPFHPMHGGPKHPRETKIRGKSWVLRGEITTNMLHTDSAHDMEEDEEIHALVQHTDDFHCTQPPLAEVTKLLCPHHEGAGAPHPFRVGGPDLWYQMTLVDTTVERSLVSSAGGARR